MATAVSHGIRVSVQARYEAESSKPSEGHYLFSYHITIANRSRRTVQLLRRHWYIADSLAPPSEVEGPGVVGAVPVLEPGEQFTYTSHCVLRSGLGRMHGHYTMQYTDDGSAFEVTIPAFELQLPFAAN